MVRPADRPVAVSTRLRSRLLSASATLLLLIPAASGSACAEIDAILPPANAPNIDLALAKTVNNAAPAEGATVTFTITVTNLGPFVATDVIAGDTLPTGLTYVSHNAAAGGFTMASGRWDVGNLAIGASAVLMITATVNSGTNGQAIVNRAGVLSSAFNDSIPLNNIASAALTVTNGAPPPPPPPPPPPGGSNVLWATSWAAGNRTDGGRLNEDLAFSTSILSVVARSSVTGLPTSWPTNVLRITFQGQNAQLVGATGLWAAPAAGAKLCFRFLAYNALPNGGGVANEHGMQSNLGDVHHFWQFFSPEANGSGTLGYGGSGAGGNNFATVPARRPMRFEECYTRTTGASARVELRVTDESTGQVYTNTHFLSQWGAAPSILVNREMTFSNEMDGFRTYYFGASGSSSGTGIGVYITGFAVCTDWCGVYSPGEGT